jgi:hypothetical protein
VSPVRIQRKRTKGWRMPPGAVYVGRPSLWGNPYRKGESYFGGSRTDSWDIVDLFRDECPRRAAWDYVGYVDWLAPLRGRDLVCWCPLDQPCHADVLLELANAPVSVSGV